jgi:hypothetical protein
MLRQITMIHLIIQTKLVPKLIFLTMIAPNLILITRSMKHLKINIIRHYRTALKL